MVSTASHFQKQMLRLALSEPKSCDKRCRHRKAKGSPLQDNCGLNDLDLTQQTMMQLGIEVASNPPHSLTFPLGQTW